MSFCEQCGAKLDEAMKFCENCGSPVSVKGNENLVENSDFPSANLSSTFENSSEVVKDGLNDATHVESDFESEEGNSSSPEKILSLEKSSEEEAEDIGDSLVADRNATDPNDLNEKVEQKKSHKKIIVLCGLLGVSAALIFFVLNQRPLRLSSTVTTTSTSQVATIASSSEKNTTESTRKAEAVIGSSEASVDKSETNASFFDKNRVGEEVESIFGGMAGNHGVVVSAVSSGNDDVYMRQENRMIRAASIAKLFIASAFLSQVEKGILDINEIYQVSKMQKVGGTGVISSMPAEFPELSFKQILHHLIVDSDNTAGNVLMEVVGGIEAVNRYLEQKGYSGTKLERYFMEMDSLAQGKDNYTTAVDCATFLKNLYMSQEISPSYDRMLLDLLQQSKNRTKLPAAIGHDVTVYNKTGEFADYGVENDVALFEKGNRAIVVVVLSDSGSSNQQVSGMNQLGTMIGNEFLE